MQCRIYRLPVSKKTSYISIDMYISQGLWITRIKSYQFLKGGIKVKLQEELEALFVSGEYD